MTHRRLDEYEELPQGMRTYLSNYGWHFNKKLCEHAVKCMKNRNDRHFSEEEVAEALKKHSVEVSEAEKYDAVYLFNMYYSDFYPKALDDESKLALAVGCAIDDEDGYEGMALTRYYADTIGRGEPLFWEKFV